MSLREEIMDLRALIAGLPADVRESPFGEVYLRRLGELEARDRHPTLAVSLLACRKDLTWADIGRAYNTLFSGTPTGTFLVFVPGTWVSYREGAAK